MARIRTIKPEFWDSPSVKGSSPWARLLFIAMWNWADDHGRGTANLKELEGFAFPNDYEFWDSSGNTVHFRDLVAEVSARFGVLFYTVNNRPYYEIPSWDSHQRNERRSKASKHPSPQVSDPVAETPYIDAETPNISGTGTGEQGNRGTGEQSKDSSSGSAGAETRPEVISILDAIDQHCADHDFRKPNRTDANLTAARLILDKDGYTLEQVLWILNWVTKDSFWTPNIRSASKLREKFEQIKAKATTTPTNTGRKSSAMAGLEAVADWQTPDHLLLEN